MNFSELEFRGVDLVTGEWVVGGCLDWQRDTPIIINHGNRHYIKPGTESVFTGFHDVNNVKIYTKQLIEINGYGNLFINDLKSLLPLIDAHANGVHTKVISNFTNEAHSY